MPCLCDRSICLLCMRCCAYASIHDDDLTSLDMQMQMYACMATSSVSIQHCVVLSCLSDNGTFLFFGSGSGGSCHIALHQCTYVCLSAAETEFASRTKGISGVSLQAGTCVVNLFFLFVIFVILAFIPTIFIFAASTWKIW